MKLTAKNKHDICIGTILQDSISRYIVTNIWTCGRSIYVTLTDTDTRQNIYGVSISSCYGMDIRG